MSANGLAWRSRQTSAPSLGARGLRMRCQRNAGNRGGSFGHPFDLLLPDPHDLSPETPVSYECLSRMPRAMSLSQLENPPVSNEPLSRSPPVGLAMIGQTPDPARPLRFCRVRR